MYSWEKEASSVNQRRQAGYKIQWFEHHMRVAVQVSRYLVKDFGTSKPPKSTRSGDHGSLTGWDCYQWQSFLAPGFSQRKQNHKEGKGAFRLEITVINPVPVIPVFHSSKSIGRPLLTVVNLHELPIFGSCHSGHGTPVSDMLGWHINFRRQ
jgi:hypothetical protein